MRHFKELWEDLQTNFLDLFWTIILMVVKDNILEAPTA